MNYLDFLIDFLSKIDTEPIWIKVVAPMLSGVDVVEIVLRPGVEYEHILLYWDLQPDEHRLAYVNDEMNLMVRVEC